MSDNLMSKVSRQQLEYWDRVLEQGRWSDVQEMIRAVLAQEAGHVEEPLGVVAPAAEVVRLSIGSTAVILKGYEDLPEGTKLYTSPPAPMVTPELDPAFEAWWESDGQYCRSGGGSYEKTFAYRAYEAAIDKAKELNQ